ncbi:ABC transporter ATP-binding protein [Candidatus Nucleicultrix amoebiphila]|jgi:lipoprotein-releasing system ATP-binding protein|uniref:ABC transporter n=1 Tax=Candidatus Nucleicultrix amoebiphila FS5 TaxID=1414854 RepID=A0A1W6N3B8_9PROT|nr:ABC transporter ATP-binding protein [Candidatus Nucleicultrix amoebiphila]ARN84374.1 ABC transporter [Candidatus Nucleicultrix amoebiphila FS5]
MSKNPVILKLENIQQVFHQGAASLEVLKGIDLEIRPGECVALVGASGSGKSTLLHITGLLEHPSKGEIYINNEACSKLRDKRRTDLRRKTIGFIYQFHHLLPEFTALENIMLPQMIDGLSENEAENRARALLTSLKLDKRASHVPAKLSGGEQQRIAILRALANRPKLLLADEPTGNLDENTADLVFKELLGLVKSQGMAALIATHNMDLAKRMDRVLHLRNGHLHKK